MYFRAVRLITYHLRREIYRILSEFLTHVLKQRKTLHPLHTKKKHHKKQNLTFFNKKQKYLQNTP